MFSADEPCTYPSGSENGHAFSVLSIDSRIPSVRGAHFGNGDTVTAFGHIRGSVHTSTTIQTAEFDGMGRRTKKVVTNSGDLDRTEVYYFDGQKIIETRDGSANVVQQFIHGTQYIDELVMMRRKAERSEGESPAIGKASKDARVRATTCPQQTSTKRVRGGKGDVYVHQDANWNVIALTDLGGSVVERYVYTPYGEVTVHQNTSWGDYDGDGDVDSADKAAMLASPPGICRGSSPGGACRLLDLDFDNDVDSTDETKFDALTAGTARHPGLTASGVEQPMTHQGLLAQPEIGGYEQAQRIFSPKDRRFFQRLPSQRTPVDSRYVAVLSDGTPLADPGAVVPGLPHFVVRETPEEITADIAVVLWGWYVVNDPNYELLDAAGSQLNTVYNSPCERGAGLRRSARSTCKPVRFRFTTYYYTLANSKDPRANSPSYCGTDRAGDIGLPINQCFGLARNWASGSTQGLVPVSVWIANPNHFATNGMASGIPGDMIVINDSDRDENELGYVLLSHEMGHALGMSHVALDALGFLMSYTVPRTLQNNELATLINTRVYPLRQPCPPTP